MSDEFVVGVKQVVADPAAGPTLDDLVNSEAGRLIAALNGDEFALTTGVHDALG
jgi:hypothetical protein